MSDPTVSSHELFDASDADITVISSDRVGFKLHLKYLESNTGVFPGAEFDTKAELIHLTEPASVLEIVFQFVYPRRHPKLNDKDFDTVLAVAEAVEKYQVFSAMNTCETRLIKFLRVPGHGAEILAHAIRHDYPDIINKAVPHLARAPLLPLLEKLPLNSVLPWVRYQEAWRAVFEKARQLICSKLLVSGGCQNSHLCLHCRAALLSRVTELEQFKTLSDLKNALDIVDVTWQNHHICPYCTKTCIYLPEVIAICKQGVNSMSPFTDFLSTPKTL